MEKPDYSQYDAMSTDALKAVLDEIDGEEDRECSDPALVAHILGLITERNREALEREFPADEMFQRFRDRYLEPSLAGAAKEKDPWKGQEGKKLRPIPKYISRVAGVAAILFLLLGMSSIIAKAKGIDFWASFARWSEGSFHFDDPGTGETELAPLPQQLEEFGAKMEHYYMPSDLLPRYLPEEYQADKLYFADDASASYVFMQLLKEGDPGNAINMSSHAYHSRDSEGFYEMDEGIDPEIYQHNGHDFYVFTNYGWISVVYRERNVEISFTGKDREVLYQIIDSVP